MISYKEWVAGTKPWRAKKEDFLQHWLRLKPNLPMQVANPIPAEHKGSTLRFDGIRITGSSEFIDAILSRLKEMTALEVPGQSLNILYKQQEDSKSGQSVANSYALYIQVKRDV